MRINLLVREYLPKISNHPLNTQLFNGCLARHTFNEFLKQDRIYLNAYALILMRIANRFQNTEHKNLLIELSKYISRTELKMLPKYLVEDAHFSLFSRKFNNSIIPNVAVYNYLNHLNEAASCHALEISLASIMPCFIIYKELGFAMQVKVINKNNPYYNWLSSYTSEQFSAYANLLLDTADKISDQLSNKQQLEMLKAFVKSIEYEIAFWDNIYWRQERKQMATQIISPLTMHN